MRRTGVPAARNASSGTDCASAVVVRRARDSGHSQYVRVPALVYLFPGHGGGCARYVRDCRAPGRRLQSRPVAAGADVATWRNGSSQRLSGLPHPTVQSLHRIQPDPSGAAAPRGESTAVVLLELQQHSLFAPFVELALSCLMVLNREQIDDEVTFNGLVLRFAPSADAVYRAAILLALKGEQEAARARWDLAGANYPSERGAVIRIIGSMAADGKKGVADLMHYTMTRSANELQ